jgi:acetoin utilization deacetylase AcuC-like enzyme
MIVAYYHPGYAAPIGKHIMPMHKFARVADALRAEPRVQLREPEPVGEADLLRVHSPEYIHAIKTGEPRTLAESQKFPWSPQLFDSVCLTSGGCLAAARMALERGVAAALVSGFHHAHADHGEGFCTFNGLVVTIDALRAAGAIRTAAVLDLDLHYGNGTAALAAARPYMTAVSVYGNDYRDNKAYTDVSTRQHEDGENHRSLALPAGCDGRMMLNVLDEALPLLLARGRPDVLLYQAGADPYREDPYSPLDLGHEDLRERDRRVFEFARDHRIPIAWVLAGGYTPDTSKVVEVHLNTFRAASDVFLHA